MQEYDKNGDGYLGPDELVNVAKDLNYKSVTAASIKALIDSIDENKDGKISFTGELYSHNYCV